MRLFGRRCAGLCAPPEQFGDAIAAREVEMMEVLRTGKTTVEIYGWELR